MGRNRSASGERAIIGHHTCSIFRRPDNRDAVVYDSQAPGCANILHRATTRTNVDLPHWRGTDKLTSRWAGTPPSCSNARSNTSRCQPMSRTPSSPAISATAGP
jgi:hypothetical protein